MDDIELIKMAILDRTTNRMINPDQFVQNKAIKLSKIYDALSQHNLCNDYFDEGSWVDIYSSIRLQTLHTEKKEQHQYINLGVKMSKHINKKFNRKFTGYE